MCRPLPEAVNIMMAMEVLGMSLQDLQSVRSHSHHLKIAATAASDPGSGRAGNALASWCSWTHRRSYEAIFSKRCLPLCPQGLTGTHRGVVMLAIDRRFPGHMTER